MQYLAEVGGVLVQNGRPTSDTAPNVASLTAYRDLFQKTAPPGAIDWDGREASFRARRRQPPPLMSARRSREVVPS
jgi:multiple sugar transport system substrate-binding protein